MCSTSFWASASLIPCTKRQEIIHQQMHDFEYAYTYITYAYIYIYIYTYIRYKTVLTPLDVSSRALLAEFRCLFPDRSMQLLCVCVCVCVCTSLTSLHSACRGCHVSEWNLRICHKSVVCVCVCTSTKGVQWANETSKTSVNKSIVCVCVCTLLTSVHSACVSCHVSEWNLKKHLSTNLLCVCVCTSSTSVG
jgi:hypothetical protein